MLSQRSPQQHTRAHEEHKAVRLIFDNPLAVQNRGEVSLSAAAAAATRAAVSRGLQTTWGCGQAWSQPLFAGLVPSTSGAW